MFHAIATLLGYTDYQFSCVLPFFIVGILGMLVAFYAELKGWF